MYNVDLVLILVFLYPLVTWLNSRPPIAGWLNVQGTTSSSHETLTNNAIFLLISFQSLKGGLQNAWKKGILDKGTETG